MHYSCFSLANQRLIYDNKRTPDEQPLTGPDGLALDTDGNIWASGNGEMSVYKINPRYALVFTPNLFENDQNFKTISLFILELVSFYKTLLYQLHLHNHWLSADRI